MLHTNIGNVRLYITKECEMYSVRTYVTYRNVICLNVCCKRKYDAWCPKLHTKRCNVRIHVTHENIMSRVRTYLTYTGLDAGFLKKGVRFG